MVVVVVDVFRSAYMPQHLTTKLDSLAHRGVCLDDGLTFRQWHGSIQPSESLIFLMTSTNCCIQMSHFSLLIFPHGINNAMHVWDLGTRLKR